MEAVLWTSGTPRCARLQSDHLWWHMNAVFMDQVSFLVPRQSVQALTSNWFLPQKSNPISAELQEMQLFCNISSHKQQSQPSHEVVSLAAVSSSNDRSGRAASTVAWTTTAVCLHTQRQLTHTSPFSVVTLLMATGYLKGNFYVQTIFLTRTSRRH